jgi:hypothetical protein
MTGAAGRLAWEASATKKAKATRARTGKAREENTGAAVNTANTRKKDQKKGDSHCASSASEKVTTPVLRR